MALKAMIMLKQRSKKVHYFCSDPHFSGEGGTIYSTGFLFVHSILADRYIHRREL